MQQAKEPSNNPLEIECNPAEKGQNLTKTKVRYPKAGERIKYMVEDGWETVEVLGRGSKATSKKNANYYNVRNEISGDKGVYLDKTIWKYDDKEDENVTKEQQDELVVVIPTREQNNPECDEAKKKELNAFSEFKVFEEVKDEGQERLSSRWVLVRKPTEDGGSKVKARLVCRGFEEEIQVQSDSPTGNKETLRMVLAIVANKGWQIKSGDVKNAYLQGENLEREVYMEPPKEMKKNNVIWKLRKAVYGMNDAGRKWYFKVGDTLSDLGCEKSKLDHCLFFYRIDGVLCGLLLVWVDDIFYAGTTEYEEKVINKFAKSFLIGKASSDAFTYIGLNIETTKEGIEIDQGDYISEKLEPAKLNGGLKTRSLDREETKLLRRLTGKINWAATQTRPDLSFTVVDLSTKFKQPVLEDLKKANKGIVRLKSNPSKLLFPKLTGKLVIEIYNDAGFRNLPDQISSGRGHVIFLKGENERYSPLAWNSNKIKRVVSSTIAAEALSMRAALDHGFFLRALLAEILGINMLEIKIISNTDSNNLFSAIRSIRLVEDKKLRLDIAQIQESVAKENIEVKWVEGNKMLADCLTKRGVNGDDLMEVLKTGRIGREKEE